MVQSDSRGGWNKQNHTWYTSSYALLDLDVDLFLILCGCSVLFLC